MKKRTLMVVAVLTAVSLLAFLAFAGTSETTGYDLFKNVLKQHETIDTESGTVSGLIVVKDNGQQVFSVSGDISGNEIDKEVSGNLKIVAEGFEKELAFYGMDKAFHILDTENNDVYVGQHNEGLNEVDNHHKGSDEFDEKSEAILDILLGDLSNQFVKIQDHDGTTNVKFELTKSEMPAIINLLASMPHERDFDGKMNPDDTDYDLETLSIYPLFNEFKALDIEVTELVEDMQIELFSIELDLDKNEQVKGLTLEAAFSGLDEVGQSHLIEVEASFTVEALENVNIEKIDLENKTIYELPEEHEHMRR